MTEHSNGTLNKMHKRILKILVVLENLSGGGAERVVLNLLRHLDQKRFQSVLFLLQGTGVYFSELPENIKVVYACKSLKYNKYLIPHYIYKLLIEACKSDIIIGALEIRSTYIAYIGGLLSHKPVIGWVHVPMDKWLKEWRDWHSLAVRFVYRRLKYVVCVSNAVAKSMGYVATVKPERLKVIYNLHEIDSIIGKGQEQLPQWFINILAKPTIIAVGQLKNHKGHDVLIKAHAKVLERGIPHNLVIIGTGPLRNELEELATHLNVESSVFLPGYILNPFNLISNATALVCSSHYEGLSNVIVEALSVGTPVVSTACGGTTELLCNGKYGILVPPSNEEALAEGIMKILTNSELWHHFSESGPERARCFASSNIVPNWEQLLMEAGR